MDILLGDGSGHLASDAETGEGKLVIGSGAVRGDERDGERESPLGGSHVQLIGAEVPDKVDESEILAGDGSGYSGALVVGDFLDCVAVFHISNIGESWFLFCKGAY